VPDLSFAVEKAEVMRFAPVPLLAFKLRVTNADPLEAHSHHRVALSDPD
jgi:hypothetical protein